MHDEARCKPAHPGVWLRLGKITNEGAVHGETQHEVPGCRDLVRMAPFAHLQLQCTIDKPKLRMKGRGITVFMEKKLKRIKRGAMQPIRGCDVVFPQEKRSCSSVCFNKMFDKMLQTEAIHLQSRCTLSQEHCRLMQPSRKPQLQPRFRHAEAVREPLP